jgi:Xaa-Pro aminopeptidase
MEPRELRTPKTELASRIHQLQQYLQRESIDGALIVQKADLFYFTGTVQDAHLYVPADRPPILMVRKDVDRARKESALEWVEPLKGLGHLAERINIHCQSPPRRMGLEFDVLPVRNYLTFQRLFDDVQWVDISDAIRRIRAVKSPYEIERISIAAGLSDRLAAGMSESLQEGMTEIELAGHIEALARKLGHQGIVRMRLWGNEMFYGHLMAGESAAVGSYLASPTGGAGIGPAVAQGPGFRRIRRHEPVLLDYVFACQGYLSDHTRIFSLDDLSDEWIRAHEAMLKIQSAIKKAARPGVVVGDLYETAIEMAADLGYADYFMGADDHRVRFIGHGIGTELDEYPFLAGGQQMTLQKGMVIALEPKLIFPGQGVVGVENTHVVEEDGLRQLGKYPDDITIIHRE